MHHSILPSILQALSTEEAKRLALFLQSPYFVGKKETEAAQRLVAYLRTPSASAKKEDIHAAVFPGKPFVFNKLEKLFSDTAQHIRHFVETEWQAKHKLSAHGLAAQGDFFLEKGLSDELKKVLVKMDALLSEPLNFDHEHIQQQWFAHGQKAHYLSSLSSKKDDANLMAKLAALDIFYLFERMMITTHLLNLNRMVPVLTNKEIATLLGGWDVPGLGAFAKTLEGGLLWEAMQFLGNEVPESEKHFANFYTKLRQHENDISPSVLGHLELLASNFCIQMTNRGSLEYRPLVFHFIKKRLSSGAAYLNGKLPAAMFQSTVSIALLLREFEWALEFIEAHRERIFGQQPSEVYYRFGLATYHFYRRDFEAVLDILLHLNFEEMQYKFSSKSLEIKALYELNSDLLDARLDAAKIYFYRETKIPADKKEMYGRFVDFTKRLQRLRSSSEAARLQKLQAELEANPQIAELTWLREKLTELSANSNNTKHRQFSSERADWRG